MNKRFNTRNILHCSERAEKRRTFSTTIMFCSAHINHRYPKTIYFLRYLLFFSFDAITRKYSQFILNTIGVDNTITRNLIYKGSPTSFGIHFHSAEWSMLNWLVFGASIELTLIITKTENEISRKTRATNFSKLDRSLPLSLICFHYVRSGRPMSKHKSQGTIVADFTFWLLPKNGFHIGCEAHHFAHRWCWNHMCITKYYVITNKISR